MDYNFKIGVGLGKIKFEYSKNQVLKILGKPDKIIDDEYFLSFKYYELGLFIDYEKEQDKLTDLNIHTTYFLYRGKDWFRYNKKNIIKEIKKIYKSKKIKFDYMSSNIDILNEEQYDFDEIGITLFFKKNKLSNVCVSKPLDI